MPSNRSCPDEPYVKLLLEAYHQALCKRGDGLFGAGTRTDNANAAGLSDKQVYRSTVNLLVNDNIDAALKNPGHLVQLVPNS